MDRKMKSQRSMATVCLSVLTNNCHLLDSSIWATELTNQNPVSISHDPWAMMMLNDKPHKSLKLQRWLNEDSDTFKCIVYCKLRDTSHRHQALFQPNISIYFLLFFIDLLLKGPSDTALNKYPSIFKSHLAISIRFLDTASSMTALMALLSFMSKGL